MIFGGYTLRNNINVVNYVVNNTVYFNDLYGFNIYSKQWRQLMSLDQASVLNTIPRARVDPNFVTITYRV